MFIPMGKIATPAWILEGYNSPAEYNKAKGIKKEKKPSKSYKIKVCPECDSSEVRVILGMEEGKGTGEWECRKCGWTGLDVVDKTLSEEEFMEHIEKSGENSND